MLRINNLKISYDKTAQDLERLLLSTLDVAKDDLLSWRICKKSVDARKKNDIKFVYSIDADVHDENVILAKLDNKNIARLEAKEYSFPSGGTPKGRAVVVGAGPAGLFCALLLARAGVKVTLLERGRPVEQRHRDVENFWKTGNLDVSSNVQFGEGGAGTFSDGKLTTGIGDPRLGFITRLFIEHGAPADIEYLSKPHIGTDKLRDVVKNIRLELEKLGVGLRYETKLVGIETESGRIKGIKVEYNGKIEKLDASAVVLATGHSARDTFKMLYDSGLEMKAKNFAVGVRIEHLQREISVSQYGSKADLSLLPVPDYKLSCHLDSGRSVFSFCVCPGGSVVASASEAGHLVTNGMSEYSRDGVNINGGLLVGVTPEDYGSSHPLAGIDFQRKLERAAFELGGGGYFAPAQLVGDFLKGRASTKQGRVTPTYRPGVVWTDIRKCLPEFISDSLAEAIPILGRKLKKFDAYDTVLTAVESRSSSPVHMVRDQRLESNIKGVYPCGEGAGFAGGIMSAAADGIRCAEKVYEQLIL